MCLGRGEGPARLSDSRDSRVGRAVAESSSGIITESSSLGVEIKQSSKAHGYFCCPTQKNCFMTSSIVLIALKYKMAQCCSSKLFLSQVSGWRRKQTNTETEESRCSGRWAAEIKVKVKAINHLWAPLCPALQCCCLPGRLLWPRCWRQSGTWQSSREHGTAW